MPLIDTIAATWSDPVTLTTAEIWQVRAGRILITTEAIVSDDQGLELDRGDALEIASGKTVRFRKISASQARIYREAR